jgi:hypothetical protein
MASSGPLNHTAQKFLPQRHTAGARLPACSCLLGVQAKGGPPAVDGQNGAVDEAGVR